MSDKNNIKENWEWDPQFPKPGTEIAFRTPSGEMTGIVTKVITNHILLVDVEDGRKDVEILELLDGGWAEREEHRARTVHEWGGAGFSYGSSMAMNRGGGINKGGFGGGSNLGGPNMMYTYEIKPLNRILQPKPTELEEIEEAIHDGHIIEGEELNKRDGKVYIGVVIKTDKLPDGSVNYYLILDDETTRKVKIDPTTAVLLSGEAWIDSRNQAPARDEDDLVRASNMMENMRAKRVNETTPQSVENFNWIPDESTLDDFFTWYAGTPDWDQDWQVMNVIEVNGTHAQEDGAEGRTWLNKLWNGKHDKVEITSDQLRPGDWDINFKYKGDEYSIQSGVKAFAKTNDY